MNQVAERLIWIGHAGDGRDWRGMSDRGIRAIVQLAIEERPIQPPREMILYRFPLVDGEGNDPALLRLAIEGVATLIRAKLPALVCCGGGMSRSPAIVAAAISRVVGMDVHESLKAVTASHPSDVSPGLWEEVCRARS